MFDLNYIGHAGWEIKREDFRIICDPWFSPNGAYFGDWQTLIHFDSGYKHPFDKMILSPRESKFGKFRFLQI